MTVIAGTAPRRYKGRGETTPIEEPWEATFLKFYEERGSISRAAFKAGVTVPYVKKRQEASPSFGEKCHLAKESFIDALEERLREIGEGTNMPAVVALLTRLKKERPSQWNEQLQITGAVAHVHAAVPPEEMQGLLKAMLKDAMPETRKQIAGEVVDADK